MKTIVISAFPACGKSYLYNNYNGQPFTMLDSDSSKFSWIYKDGVKTDERNPNFIEDYMKHIKENIGKVDVIFVSSHKEVRAALRMNGIKYVQVFPSLRMKDEMLERMAQRGNDEKFIKFQEENFEKFYHEVRDELERFTENRYISRFVLTQSNPYISLSMISGILSNEEYEPMWNYPEEA